MSGLRSLKFVKYLPAYGWNPVVLSIAAGDYLYHDPTLLQELPPSIKVHRVFAFQPTKIYRDARRLMGQVCGIKDNISDFIRLPNERKVSGAIGYLKNFVSRNFLVPDDYIGWLPFAVSEGMRLLKRGSIDLIFTTSGAETAHLVGFLLKKFTAKPWVVDFRDWWTAYRDNTFRPPLALGIERKMEAAVLKSADRVVVATPFIGDLFVEQYQFLNPSIVRTITNGFDPDDFEKQVAINSHERFTLTYTGSVYPSGGIRPFFEALLRLPETVKKNFRVNIVGGMQEGDRVLIAQMGLQDIVITHPFIPHRKAIDYMLCADALLLLIAPFPGSQGMYTGKLFDYLGARKPILALVTDGLAADLIRELQVGVVVHPEDTEGIIKAITVLYEKYKSGTLQPIDASVQLKRFERRELTRQLAEVFEDVLEKA